MKKCLVSAFIFMLFAAANGQPEKFDIATFTPPQGWERSTLNGSLAFMHSKTDKGLTSFCQIILYPSANSTADADANFKSAWQNLVVSPTKSDARPVTQTEKTPEGWTVVTGSATVSFQGMNYNSLVFAITGFGKTMNVQVNLAGNDYSAILEKFFNDLDLDSKATVSNQANRPNNDKVVSGTITLGDYEFIAPEKWAVQKEKDHLLVHNPESGCQIRILEPQQSSGDLEQDAKAVFELMYQGWKYQRTGAQQYLLSKGLLAKGLEFFMMEAGMSKLSPDGSRYEGFEDGAVLIVKAGSQIVIIAVRHGSLLAHSDCYRKYETWRRFFNSITVKNVPVPNNAEDYQQRIVGKWAMSESGALGEYVFAANGNYAFSGAIGSTSTSRDYNYEYLHIKTYAFDGDGSYTVTGNQLTLKKRTRNSPEQARIRFEKLNRGGTGWKDRLWMLTKDSVGEVEVGYEKADK